MFKNRKCESNTVFFNMQCDCFFQRSPQRSPHSANSQKIYIYIRLQPGLEPAAPER